MLLQIVLGFDLEVDSLMAKIYYIPTLKAMSVGKSKLEIVTDAILGLPDNEGTLFSQSLHAMVSYLHSFDICDSPKVEIFAIDCTKVAKSRLKIDVRSQNTTFASMLDFMSLGGTLPPYSQEVLQSIAEL